MVGIQHEEVVPDPTIIKKQHGNEHSSGDGPNFADDSFETTSTSISELTPENIEVETFQQHDGPSTDVKSPTNRAPEPPRWRFVAKAKKADGYSSREAGEIVRGKSSHELGAKYVAPEITKDEETVTRRNVGSLSIEDTGTSVMEVFVGGTVITHNPNGTSGQDISSRVWASGYHPKPTEFRETKYEKDKWTNLVDDESRISKDLKSVGKLNFGQDYTDEDIEGSWSPTGKSTETEESDYVTFINSLSPDAHQMLGSYLRNKPEPSDKDMAVIDLLDKLLADEPETDGTKNVHDYDDDVPVIDNEPSMIRTTGSTNIESDSDSEKQQGDGIQKNNPDAYDHISIKGDLSENNSIDFRRRRRFLLLLLVPLLIVAVILGVVLGRKAAPDDGTIIFAIGIALNGTDQPSSQPSDGLPWETDAASSLVPIGDLTPSPISAPGEALANDSPTQQTIAFIGGCPKSFISRYSYEIGTQVQSQGIVYECLAKDCGAYGNEPGSTDYSWKEKWKVIGSCSGTVGPTSSVVSRQPPPSYSPSNQPVTDSPSRQPTLTPVTNNPTKFPTLPPVTDSPTNVPIQKPVTASPSGQPTKKPATIATSSVFVSVVTQSPSKSPSDAPSNKPTAFPITLSPTTLGPSISPTIRSSDAPIDKPTSSPSDSPTKSSSEVVTYAIFEVVPPPSNAPTPVPSINPTPDPTFQPSPEPSLEPTPAPSLEPTQEPSPEPSLDPTLEPTQPVNVPTLKPTCAENGDFNLCLAIDMSGSVCGATAIGSCENCGQCNSGGLNLSICCSNFANVLDFSKSLVRSLGDLRTNQDFSVVTFSTDADIVSTLENRNQAVKTINQLKYDGGSTNLAEAISSCQSTLDDSPSDRKNLILVITDGAPTIPELNAAEAATAAANNAKDKDIFIIPILIEDRGSQTPELSYLQNNISSDGQVFVADFNGLGNLQDAVFEQVVCQANQI